VTATASVRFCDTTLRDGQQAAGVAFSVDDAVDIALALDAVGVEQIEAGTPAAGCHGRQTVAAVLQLNLSATVSAWCRCRREDVDAARAVGATTLHIAVPSSDLHIGQLLGIDRAEMLSRSVAVVDYALEHSAAVSVGLEDASRADEGFLIELGGRLAELGVRRFRYADTVGVLEPISAVDRLRRLTRQLPAEWEIHAHNDFGLATANTLAALQAGFTWASTTVTGIGERAGNASLSEVAMAARHLCGRPLSLNTTGLPALTTLVARASGIAVPAGAPIVGSRAFAHESGVHVDGMLKSPRTYEPYDPAEIGARRRLVLGAQSGRASLRAAAATFDLDVNEEELVALVEAVRNSAVPSSAVPSGRPMAAVSHSVSDITRRRPRPKIRSTVS
jgi:homocitrate synthase NifV